MLGTLLFKLSLGWTTTIIQPLLLMELFPRILGPMTPDMMTKMFEIPKELVGCWFDSIKLHWLMSRYHFLYPLALLGSWNLEEVALLTS
jgi:hypothetical protein